MSPELGVVEGYFGTPWSPADRKHVIAVLAGLGYAFFHFAPKADVFLRRRWREPHPCSALADLADLSRHCRARGMRFGVGLSPYNLFRDFTGNANADFLSKVRALDAVGLDDLAILFDDMRGDVPELAVRQAEIVHAAIAETRATRVVMCPTYYSDDRMLDAVFGERPSMYLDDLGRRLDPRVGVYWTGEEICTREFSPGHLAQVSERLRRKPFLWDNYPVNDGPRMSRHLHLRAVTGRPGAIAPLIAAHAVNPALQPHLSLISLASLVASYRDGTAYCYMRAFRDAACELAGPELAAMLEIDLLSLQDMGVDRLGPDRQRLRRKYAELAHPMASEVVRWLDGAYSVDGWNEGDPG